MQINMGAKRRQVPSRTVFPNGRAAARYRALASIIPGREDSVSQRPGRGQVPGPGINYTGPREVLLEFVILVF